MNLTKIKLATPVPSTGATGQADPHRRLGRSCRTCLASADTAKRKDFELLRFKVPGFTPALARLDVRSLHDRTECYARSFYVMGTGKPGLGQGFKVRLMKIERLKILRPARLA